MNGDIIRPSTKDSSQIIKSTIIDPAKYKERLARQKVNEEFILHRSGDLAITTEQHQRISALFKTLEKQGLDTSDIVFMFNEVGRQSPDTGGRGRLQAVQLQKEENIILPGAGTLTPPPEQKIGFFRGLWNKITGQQQQEPAR